MKSFYINPETGDFEFDGSNNIKMVEGDAELVQSLYIRLQTAVGEWFLNLDFGFDRYAHLGKKLNRERLIDSLYSTILQNDRIASVEEVNIDIIGTEKRSLKVTFKAIKVSGGTIEGGTTV